jgi:hypothetical protein
VIVASRSTRPSSYERVLALTPAGGAEPPSTAAGTALNLGGRLPVEAEEH